MASIKDNDHSKTSKANLAFVTFALPIRLMVLKNFLFKVVSKVIFICEPQFYLKLET